MGESIPFDHRKRLTLQPRACAECVAAGVPKHLSCAHFTLQGHLFPARREWNKLIIYGRGSAIAVPVLNGEELPLPEIRHRPQMLFDDALLDSSGRNLTVYVDVFKTRIEWPPSMVYLDVWWNPRGEMEEAVRNLQYCRMPGHSSAKFNLDVARHAMAFVEDEVARKGRPPGSGRYWKSRREFEQHVYTTLKNLAEDGTDIATLDQIQAAAYIGCHISVLQDYLRRFRLDWRTLRREIVRQIEKAARATG